MTKDNKATEHNNQKREIKLEPKELMRLSLFDADEDNLELCYEAGNDVKPSLLLQVLEKVLKEAFGRICIPVELLHTVISVTCGNASDLENIIADMYADDGNGEGSNTDAKGETTNNPV